MCPLRLPLRLSRLGPCVRAGRGPSRRLDLHGGQGCSALNSRHCRLRRRRRRQHGGQPEHDNGDLFHKVSMGNKLWRCWAARGVSVNLLKATRITKWPASVSSVQARSMAKSRSALLVAPIDLAHSLGRYRLRFLALVVTDGGDGQNRRHRKPRLGLK